MQTLRLSTGKASLLAFLISVTAATPALAAKYQYRVAAPGMVAPPAHPVIVLNSLTPNFGDLDGGMPLSVLGSGLSEVSGVKFGTVPGTFSIIDPTSLSVTIPAAAAVGTTSISVEDPYGQLVVAPVAFTYTDLLRLSSGSPLNGIATGGTQLTLTGTFSGVADETFWIGGSPAVVASWTNPNDTVVVTVPAGAVGNAPVAVKRGSRTRMLSTDFQYIAVLSASSFAYSTQTPGLTTKLPPQGGSVRVAGTSFDSSSRVFVGASSSIVPTAVTPTGLTFLAPANTAGTSADVRIESPPQSYTAASALQYVAPAIATVSPNTGDTAGNSQVTISGSNFLPGATVQFGGAAGVTPTVSVDGTSISVRTPAAAAGAVNVVVTNPGGTTATKTSSFTYALATQNATIAANVVNYNLKTALGNPTVAKKFVVTLSSGVVVTSSSPFTAAFDTGALPTGSTVTIINNGAIIGKGGAGGYPGTGGAGGDALSTSVTLTIDNTNGYIFGGGGGGGAADNGVGGGGGAGLGAGSSGSRPGGQGSGGITGTGGGGNSDPAYGYYGGNGGSYGTAGGAGTYDYRLVKQAGGAGGRAVRLGGKTVTWVAGNTAAKVKGAVN